MLSVPTSSSQDFIDQDPNAADVNWLNLVQMTNADIFILKVMK